MVIYMKTLENNLAYEFDIVVSDEPSNQTDAVIIAKEEEPEERELVNNPFTMATT